MKTAVKQLIERLKNDWNIVLSDNVVDFYLEKEKEQITDSYIEGCRKGFNSFGEDSEKYYNETYTQSSE